MFYDCISYKQRFAGLVTVYHVYGITAMENDTARQSLLPALLDRTPQTTNNDVPRTRRYRRCKSAPLAEHVTSKINGDEPLPRSESFFNKIHPSFRQVAVLLVIYLGVGTICFYLVRNQIVGKKTNGVLDSVYFCIVTMTTVGYGDLVPNGTLSKFLACAFVFTGMVLGAVILSKAADYLLEKQETLLVKTLHMRQKLSRTEMSKELEKNKLRYKCFMMLAFLFVLMVVGTVFLVIIEKLDIVDAFYCACSTITTLGYGDKSFSTEAGRVFAIFWILTSTISVGQFFLYLAELYTERRQKALVKWVLTKRVTNVDLEAADLDNDGIVG